MIVEKKVKQREFIETKENYVNDKIDLSLFKKKSSSRTPKGLVIGYAKKLSNSKGNLFTKAEMLYLFSQLHKEISNLETSEKFKQESWKGKSGIHFILKPDKVICVSYQKYDKDEEPKEIKHELTKEEINKVIWAINKLDKGEKIPTSEIAELVYSKKWKTVFSSRPEHITLTKILNYIEHRGDIIYYRSGKIKVLRKLNWW